jgi:Zn-dependent M32 family carboxypeptidase
VYNLRVSIRFGLEQALVTSALAVKDREELYHFDVFPRNSSHAYAAG